MLLKIIEEDNKLEYLTSVIARHLKIIKHEINTIFFKNIKISKTINEAQSYFDILEKVQSMLAGLFFKEKITLSRTLRQFVSDCDRLDDPWLRNYLFQLIKAGKYNYEFN